MSNANSSTEQNMVRLVTPITDDYGVELVDVEYHDSHVKVVIDQPDGLESGVLVEVTKAISRMIDAEDPIPGTFTLEVTSPGVERPLKRPAHFQRAVGSAVAIKTNPDVEGDRRIEGVLVTADEFGVTVERDDGEQRLFKYGEIKSARTVFDWGPAPKPGKQKKPKANTKESANR